MTLNSSSLVTSHLLLENGWNYYKDDIFSTLGAPFHTRNTDGISQESFLYNIKLSNDERFLVFENLGESGEDIGPIDLCKIAEISDEGTEGERNF